IVFGISVFHAYGHQWVCQLWYHPQKSDGWGLTDGEGCEHLWSDLWHLIPNLHVAGFITDCSSWMSRLNTWTIQRCVKLVSGWRNELKQ
ncbi:hypothetical protein BS47DRAFT_1295128, partial [Hydnum rufescens UP504]